ncbi:glycoside hydrolase [Auricularia subglabra TFB-10046 SS5]|nr:glycoside hydrolase [Auricularia subglabra TFB-10046 SS5]
MAAHTEELKSDWSWKQRNPDTPVLEDKDGWTPASAMPSEIHLELMKAGQIPDPFVGHNEHKVQWVGQSEWLYTTGFKCEAKEHVELVFEGLDTFCTVYLNGNVVLEADNMFRPWVVSVDPKSLKPTNSLLLHFKSAKLVAKELEAKYGRVRAGSCNLGDPSRVYVRKAQYHWRWDWGPEILCAGPWLPIHLKTYHAAFDEVYAAASVSGNLESSLRLDVSLKGGVEAADAVRAVLRDASGTVVAEVVQKIVDPKNGKGLVKWDLGTDKVKLWWPVGYGAQNLYTVETTLLGRDQEVLDVKTQRIGFRRVVLVQEPLKDQPGTTFVFEINNVRIFMGGSNWIPADSFLTRITVDDYRKWLTLLVEGNQNMIRIWGGGVYEPSHFYDICDELGILVWQDFQFACGVYPALDYFVKSVTAEAEANIVRLRRHPSIVLWCGNNEDYQQVLQWGDVKDLPAKLFYENILPATVARLTDPQVPYWPGSPFGGEGWDTSDPTVGDVHQWKVWGGAGIMEYYQNYDILGGRFVSEFGIPAFPDLRTVDYWLNGDTSQRYSQSRTNAQHNKAGAHERRFAILMNENFRITNDFESHVYLTQLMQSEGVSGAYRVWRREWKGEGRQYTAGVLVWQLNDCWPVTSWALADYFLRCKPVYFTIKRELRPYTVGLLRTVVKNRWDDRPRQYYEFGAYQSRAATLDIWATNATLAPKNVTLELEFFDLEQPAWKWAKTYPLTLEPNQTTETPELLKFAVPYPPEREPPKEKDPTFTPTYSVIAYAKLKDENGQVLARCADWPQPYRYLEFPEPGLEIARGDGENLAIQATKAPIKGLVLSAVGDGPEVKWSDNGLELWPGDVQIVEARGLGSRKVRVQHLGNEHGRVVSF